MADPSFEQAVRVEKLSHRYGKRLALNALSVEIAVGEIFVFLGPNGGGKTTLFRALSTLIPVQEGSVEILGWDLRQEAQQIRRRMGVVFQAPSLDKKLTVLENIRHQAALYGVGGRELVRRQETLLEQLGLRGRERDYTETLSGGLRRRVELAKGMIHQPQLLLMDEPSTGLDPGARADLWAYLIQIRDRFGVTIAMTTHLLEEASRADRIAILNEGAVVAIDTPDALRRSVGGDTITISTATPVELAAEISTAFGLRADVVDGAVRLEQPDATAWIAKLADSFPAQIEAIRLAKPTLEDVFIQKTGHRFWQQGVADDA